MKVTNFRRLLSSTLSGFNAYFGDNIGDFNDEGYKLNYQIVSSVLLGGQRTYMVDIDIYSNDDVIIENIGDDVEQLLDYKSKHYDHDESDTWCTFFLESRYNNDDRNTYRRTLSYEVRTYDED